MVVKRRKCTFFNEFSKVSHFELPHWWVGWVGECGNNAHPMLIQLGAWYGFCKNETLLKESIADFTQEKNIQTLRI